MDGHSILLFCSPGCRSGNHHLFPLSIWQVQEVVELGADLIGHKTSGSNWTEPIKKCLSVPIPQWFSTHFTPFRTVYNALQNLYHIARHKLNVFFWLQVGKKYQNLKTPWKILRLEMRRWAQTIRWISFNKHDMILKFPSSKLRVGSSHAEIMSRCSTQVPSCINVENLGDSCLISKWRDDG